MSTNMFSFDESPCLPPVSLDPWLPASGLGFRLSISSSDDLFLQSDKNSITPSLFPSIPSPLSSAGGGFTQSTFHPSRTVSGPSRLSTVSLSSMSLPLDPTDSPTPPTLISARKQTKRDTKLGKGTSTDSIREQERERRLNYLGQLNKRDSLVVVRAEDTTRAVSWSDVQNSLNRLPPSSWSPSTVDSASSSSTYSDYLDSSADSDTESSPPSSPSFSFRRTGRTRSISLTFSFESKDTDDTKEPERGADRSQFGHLPQLLSNYRPVCEQTVHCTPRDRHAPATTVGITLPSLSSSPPRLIQAFADDCDSDDDYSDLGPSFPVPTLAPATIVTSPTRLNFDFRKSSGWKDVYIRPEPTQPQLEPTSLLGGPTDRMTEQARPTPGPCGEQVRDDDGEIDYLSTAIRHQSTPPSSLSTRASAATTVGRPTELGTKRVIQPMSSTVSLPSLCDPTDRQTAVAITPQQRSSLPVLERLKDEHRPFDRLAIFLNKSSTTNDLVGLSTESSRPRGDRAWSSTSPFEGKNVPWGGQLKVIQAEAEQKTTKKLDPVETEVRADKETDVEETPVVLAAPILVEEKRLPAIPSEQKQEQVHEHEPATKKCSPSPSFSSSSSGTSSTTRRPIDERLPFQTTFVARAKTENALQAPKTPLLHSSENPLSTKTASVLVIDKANEEERNKTKEKGQGQKEDELCYCGTAYLKSRLNAPVKPHLRSTHKPSLAPSAEPPRRRRRQQYQQQQRQIKSTHVKQSSAQVEKKDGKSWKGLFLKSRLVQPSI